MANQLDQDPIYIDANATDVKCLRIRAVKFDTASAAATASIVDGTTSHIIWSSTGPTFDEINVTLPYQPDGSAPVIDVTRSAGAVLIYLGSGPR